MTDLNLALVFVIACLAFIVAVILYLSKRQDARHNRCVNGLLADTRSLEIEIGDKEGRRFSDMLVSARLKAENARLEAENAKLREFPEILQEKKQ